MPLITTEHTELLQKAVREIVNDPATYMGASILPSVALPVLRVRVDVIEASGGLTNEHLVDTDVKYIQRAGFRTEEFEPAYYKEAIPLRESELLYLRKLGDNDRSQRGVRQYIDLAVDRLNRRIEARIEKQRWDSLINGGFTWLGKTISFGIPALNQAVPIGALWSLNGITANAAATPLIDIQYWVTGGYPGFRKYKINRIVSNPNTARMFLTNPNVRAYIQNAFANPNIAGFNVNTVLNFFIPGAPPWEIYQGWYQNESVDPITGRLTVSDAQYMLPDGYLFFDVTPMGDKLGEFVQTLSLSGGSVDDPQPGKFLVVDDNTAPGTKGGPGNPYIDLIGGVYGMVKLDRPFDVLTAKVF